MVGLVKDTTTSPNHHTIGDWFICWDGFFYYCDSHEDNYGYWMTREDTPVANRTDRETRYRKNVSEHAIDRTFHRIEAKQKKKLQLRWDAIGGKLAGVDVTNTVHALLTFYSENVRELSEFDFLHVEFDEKTRTAIGYDEPRSLNWYGQHLLGAPYAYQKVTSINGQPITAWDCIAMIHTLGWVFESTPEFLAPHSLRRQILSVFANFVTWYINSQIRKVYHTLTESETYDILHASDADKAIELHREYSRIRWTKIDEYLTSRSYVRAEDTVD